jgi:hypothetical protein
LSLDATIKKIRLVGGEVRREAEEGDRHLVRQIKQVLQAEIRAFREESKRDIREFQANLQADMDEPKAATLTISHDS